MQQIVCNIAIIIVTTTASSSNAHDYIDVNAEKKCR